MMYRPEEIAVFVESYAKLIRMFSERWELASVCQGGVQVTHAHPWQGWGASIVLDKEWYTEVSVWGIAANGLNTRVTQKFLRLQEPGQVIEWVERIAKLFEDKAL